jgi:O-antigen/teichoic acid export membrane protein
MISYALKTARQISKSPIFHYIITKYLSYGLQFINAFLIARYLGLFYFGIYGFTNLVLQYLSYTNLGVQYSFNVLVSTEKNISLEKTRVYLSNSILVSIIIGICILILVILAFYLGLLDQLDKYMFKEYYIVIIVTAVFQYLNNIYINLFRIFNKLQLINLSGILPSVMMIICLFFFREKELFWALLYAFMLSQIILVVLFVIRAEVKFQFRLDRSVSDSLIRRGIFLLAYNLSFYLIILTARTLVSYFYSVKEFGLFNFANSLSVAIMMLIGSFGFLVFPKMLNRFSILEGTELISFLEKSRRIYLFGTFFIVFISIAFLPLIFEFLPEYKGARTTIIILLLSQIILENNFGYPTLLIQKGKEMTLTLFGYIAVLVVLLTGLFFTVIMKYGAVFLSVSVVISVIVYSQMVIIQGNKITGQFKSRLSLYLYVYNYRYFLPLLIFVILYFSLDYYFINVAVAIVLFTVLNIREFREIFRQSKNLLLNTKLLDIDGIR